MPEHFRAITRCISNPLVLLAPDGTILATNPAAAEAFGTTVHVLQGRGFQELIAESPERFLAYVRMCAQTTSDLPGVFHAPRGNGKVRFRCEAGALLSETKKPAVVLRFWRQDSEDTFALLGKKIDELNAEILLRKRTEDALAAQARRLAVLQTVTAAFSKAATANEIARVVVTTILDLLGASSAAVYVTCEPSCEMRLISARNVAHRLPDHVPLDTDQSWSVAEAIRSRRTVWTDDESHIDAPRQESVASASLPQQAVVAIPLMTGGGLAIGCLRFTFDAHKVSDPTDRELLLTVSRQCSQALDRARLYDAERASREVAERAMEDARAAERRKDEFLAVLGHELRNPLAPIFTALELMRLRGPDSAFLREREIITDHMQHLSRLVDDLLDLSRITRGRLELRRQIIEVSPVVSRAIEMASPLLDKKSQHLISDVPSDGLVVDADPMRLSQVIANLVGNAAKYTQNGGHIRVSARRDTDHVVISVSDDGIGIAPDSLPLVFDMFVQGDRGIDRADGGLGLGLTIARSLVALHGGRVEAKSKGLGQGSEFSVRLPSAKDGTVPTRRESSDLLASRASDPSLRRVLVVDDNTDAAELLAETLQALGYVAHVAFDGPSALAEMATFHPDAAILDIGLPVMDGYELARRIRQSEVHANIGLLALTGYGQDSDRRMAQEAGFNEHLVKPVDIDRLSASLERVITACPVRVGANKA